MARIELRYCTIRLKDGLAGTAAVNAASDGIGGSAAVNQPITAPLSGDTTLTIDTVAITGGDHANLVPIGSKFTIAGETASTTKHTVLTRTPSGLGPTTVITFSPALTTGTYLDNGVLTFTPTTPTAPMTGDTVLLVKSVVLNTDVTTKIPVGARFTIAGESASTTVHTVTARVQDPDTDLAGVTLSITISPALTAGTYANGGVLTFLPIALVIKVGEGDLKYTENHAFKYDLDRGILDTVRIADDVPLDLTTSFTYEHITTGTNETISPVDFIKRRGQASEFVSSATDKCEPYAVDFEITFQPPCGTTDPEVTIFPDFRAEKIEPDFKNSLITLTGKCHALEPLVYRTLQP